MKKQYARILVGLGILGIGGAIVAAMLFMGTHNIAVLNPKGEIAEQQRHLMLITTLLMLIVVVPVFMLTFWVVWRYRAGNKKATYSPEWDRSRIAEMIWWLVPLVIIGVLAGITWVSSHRLDPYRPLTSEKSPVTIKVIALQWKWLFIYPEQNVASVNFVQLPKDRPVNFEITADAPMNSFWIPQLGGQVYAMAGMSTKLHLMGNEIGNYKGSSANLSGEGFADMKFTARVGTEADFSEWVKEVKRSPAMLNAATYSALAQPGKEALPTYYATTDPSLYDSVIMKYMMPKGTMPAMHHEQE